MAKRKSQTFYCTFFLVTFLVFVISLETAAKQVKPAAGGTESKEGNKIEYIQLFMSGLRKDVVTAIAQFANLLFRNFCFVILGARFSRWLEQAEGKASKRRLRRMVPGYIYLIAAFKDAPVEPAFVKIGIAGSPSHRLKNLQTGSPYPLKLMHKWKVTDRWRAEKEAHKAMEQWNRARLYRNKFRYWTTEWFDIPQGELEIVKGIVTNAMSVYLARKPRQRLKKTLVATKFS